MRCNAFLSIARPNFLPKRSFWPALLLGSTSALLTAVPAPAAEEIEFTYGLFSVDVSVASLALYAQEGTVNSDLASYLRFLNREQQAQVRAGLQTSRQVSPWQVSQVLYAPLGEASLRNIGALIQTDSGLNGFYALRAALIQSANDPQGLSVLGALRHYPSHTVRIDLAALLQVAHQTAEFAQITDTVIADIQARSAAAAATEAPVNWDSLPSLQGSGPFQFSRQTLWLHDGDRDRDVPTDLYVPVFTEAMPNTIPVVVYSHGLGETRTTAAPFLELLASYGFVVAAPEHVGSDYQIQQDVLQGLAQDAARPDEFFNRPLDISYVLDVLEQRNATEFGDRLNLQQVGAFGHSFGGYTVLALAGATVDFDQLQTYCQEDAFLRSLDTAVLLQCRAMELTSFPEEVALLTSGQLKDPRIKAVFAATPVTRAVFSQSSMSQIDVPVLLLGGGHDPVTPLVPEQVRGFSWLTTPERYLLVSSTASHSAGITEIVNRLLLPSEPAAQEDEPLAVFLDRLRGFGVAFMQVYVADQAAYRPYLQASYVQSLNVPPFDFNLIRTLSPEELEQLIQQE
ncbi:MAG TPA: alpha/beta hydrolase [Chroococcidiopsis sp.]